MKQSERLVVSSRRGFLGMTAGLATAAALPAWAFPAADAVLTADGPKKFLANGRVNSFRGNTVVCHLPQQGPESTAFDVLLDFYRVAPWRTFGRKVTLLPPSSYHMTLIGGATEFGRTEAKWPRGIPLDAPIEECNRIVGERIRLADFPPVFSIRMKIDAEDSGYDGNTLRIPLEPVNADESQRVEDLRAALARAIGIPVPAPGNYQFHITLGYVIERFNAAEQRSALAAMEEWKERLARRVPVLTLGIPEYCVFDDMFAFKRQFYIGLAG